MPLLTDLPRRRVLGNRLWRFSLRVDQFLYHRFWCLSRGYRVCVSMHNLPDTTFSSKDHRSPQSERGDIFPSANLGFGPLYLHNVGKLRSRILHYDLETLDLAIFEIRCGTIDGLINLHPPTHGRAKGVSEGYIFLMGEDLLHRLGVAFHECTQR